MSRLIIYLYDEFEESFRGNGIAAISEVFDPLIIHEKNSVYTFEFKFKKDHPFYSHVKEGRFVKVDDTVFIIRLIDEYAEGRQHIVHVQCEHIMFELLDEFVPLFSHQNSSPQYILDSILDGTRFTGESKVNVPGGVNIQLSKSSKLNCLDKLCENANAIRICSGMPDENGFFKIILLSADGEPKGILVHNRKNKKSIRRIIDGNNVVTRIYPYGADDLTIQEAVKSDGKIYIDSERINEYCRPKERAVKFDNINDPDTLYEVALDYLKKNEVPRKSYEVDLDYLKQEIGQEKIEVGDKILVIDEELDGGVTLDVVVSRIEIDPSPYNRQVKVVLEEAIPSFDKLMADLMLLQETETGVRRGNVWVEFVTVPFSNETITIEFSVPFKTKPVVNVHVIGEQALQPIVKYIQQTVNQKPIWTGCTISIPEGNGEEICMMAIGRV